MDPLSKVVPPICRFLKNRTCGSQLLHKPASMNAAIYIPIMPVPFDRPGNQVILECRPANGTTSRLQAFGYKNPDFFYFDAPWAIYCLSDLGRVD